MKWKRTTDFNYDKIKNEKWIFKDNDTVEEFNVEVTLSKAMNVFSLKNSDTDDFKKNINKIKTSREKLYSEQLEFLHTCPICNDTTENSKLELKVYNAEYVRCNNCNHIFTRKRPSKEKIEEFYKNDCGYQSTYADKASLMARVEEISIPKVKFITDFFLRNFGRKPKKILDVGAGSGHFVHACKILGFEADGIEISYNGRKFAKENFEIDLIDGDLVEICDKLDEYDIITFWGVIEHVTKPLEMLKAAKKTLGNTRGLIVAEVPRWDSISTCIQSETPNTIIRHLEPLGHINCFTDMSIATSFVKSDLDIIGAWYFGMDAFELINQLNYGIKSNKLITHFENFVPRLQEQFDLAKLSDEIVLIGTNK